MAVGMMAGWVASAGADIASLPPPPITLPTTITIPSVTVPSVSTPTATAPPVPPAPPAPHAPPAPTVPNVTLPHADPLPAPGVGQGASSSGAGSGSGSGAAPRSSNPRPQGSGGPAQPGKSAVSQARVHRLRLTRDWISMTGSKNERRTTLVFTLRRAALVEIVILKLSPNCRTVGRVRVRGHPGVNRVRLRSRVGGRSLSPGKYRIVARTVPGRWTRAQNRLFVVDRANRRELEAARRANSACPRSADLAGASAATTGGLERAKARRSATAGSNRAHADRSRGVLGTRFAKRAVSVVKDIPTWLYALSAVAIALLTAGALLPKRAPTGLAASIVCGLTGAAVLFVATIAYALL